MTRSLAVAVGAALLAVPSAASAATLSFTPQKPCYRSGEKVNLLGTGFTPLGSASVTRDGTFLDNIGTDANGAFNGVLTFGQDRGRETRTYKATDGSDSSITASTQVTVSALRVGLKPANGAPGRIMSITATGFTTGPVLWAHVRHGGSGHNIKVGRLSGACGGLRARKRLLPQDAALGVHTIQFDTFKRYSSKRPVRDRYTISVTRG